MRVLAGVRLHLRVFIYGGQNLVMAVDSYVTVFVSHIAEFGFITAETVVTEFIKFDTVWFIKKMVAGVNILKSEFVNYVSGETPVGLKIMDTSVFLAPLCITVANSGYQEHKVCVSCISCLYRKPMLQVCLFYYLGGYWTLISMLFMFGCYGLAFVYCFTAAKLPNHSDPLLPDNNLLGWHMVYGKHVGNVQW